MLTLTLVNEFVKMLGAHDFWFQYSDDGGVWRRGQQSQDNIMRMIQKYPKLQPIYQAYGDKMNATDNKLQHQINYVEAIEQVLAEEGIAV